MTRQARGWGASQKRRCWNWVLGDETIPIARARAQKKLEGEGQSQISPLLAGTPDVVGVGRDRLPGPAQERAMQDLALCPGGGR